MTGTLRYIILLIILASCANKKNVSKTLEQYNQGSKNEFNQAADSLISGSTKQYCFEIHHDQLEDLGKYHLAVEIEGTFVYSDKYKAQIIVPFNRIKKWNDFVVFLYDPATKRLYSWSNKEVYDFKERSDKCYEVTLLSDKNMDHTDGIKMKID